MVEVVFLARVNNKERDPPRGPQHEEHAEQNITYQTEARDVGGGPDCCGRGGCQRWILGSGALVDFLMQYSLILPQGRRVLHGKTCVGAHRGDAKM